MRMIKLLGMALMATLAFSAVGAIGAGSASALLFLTESGKELLFTVKNLTLAIFENKMGFKVECEVVLGHGFIVHKTDIARKILLTFHECTSTLGNCTSAGEPVGLIKTLDLHALLVTLLEPLDKYGLKLLAENGNIAEFTCGNSAVVVRGSVVGEFEETLLQSQAIKKTSRLLFERGIEPGTPAIKDYWNLEGIGTARLEMSVAPFGFEEANLQVLLDLIYDGGVAFCHN